MNLNASRHPNIFQYICLISLDKSKEVRGRQEIRLGPNTTLLLFLYNHTCCILTFIHRVLQTPPLRNKSSTSKPNLIVPHTNPHMASCGSWKALTHFLCHFFDVIGLIRH